MISLPIGFLLTGLVFIISIGTGNLSVMLNSHSGILVIGGTFGILFFATPLSTLKGLFREIKNLFLKEVQLKDLSGSIVKLSQNRSIALENSHELIDYAKELWDQGTSQDLFVVLLSQKRKEIEQKSSDAIQSLKNLAKYPPAMGMAGTVMGIVVLFQSLQENKNNIGPAFAMALTATLYGLILANAVVMPLADRLHVRHLGYQNFLSHLYSLLLLINQEEASQIISDEVKARAG